MNLETRIDRRLWDATRINLESRNFTGAILDGMHFLSDLLRQRSGLEGDGASLVGQALGGDSPKLRVNRLQSESDRNVQKGIEQLLRGMYQAIRNPRSHEKYSDSEVDAEAIVLFIDYIVKIVDQAKSPFVRSEFLARVLDPYYVVTNQYSKLLVEEIPVSQRLAVFFDVFRAKNGANEQALEHFFVHLLAVLTGEEKEQVHDAVSQELKTVQDEADIRFLVRCFGADWASLNELGRLRIENRLLNSVKEGRYELAERKCRSGALGTWSERIFVATTLKADFLSALTDKLASGSAQEQNYVFQYLFSGLSNLAAGPDARLNRVFLEGVKAGDDRFASKVRWGKPWPTEKWREDVQTEVKAFKEKNSFADFEDDIPF